MIFNGNDDKNADEIKKEKGFYRLKQYIVLKKKIVYFVIFIILVLILGILLSKMNTVDRYLHLVNEENNNEALSLYNEKIKDNDDLKNELIEKQNDYMDSIYDSFLNEQTDYDESKNEINKFTEYEISKAYADSIEDKINSLNRSRTAFENAVNAEKSNDIGKAIENYKAVIKDDSNYKTAQSKIDSLSESWKKSLLDEAKDYSNNKDYQNAIKNIDTLIRVLGASDELNELKKTYENLDSEKYVKVFVSDKINTPKDINNWIFSNYVNIIFELTNNSEKPIKGIEGFLTVKDLFGKEILTCGCDFTGINIQPSDTITVDNLSYECNEFLDTDNQFYTTDYEDLKFEYKIESIVYTDGTAIEIN